MHFGWKNKKSEELAAVKNLLEKKAAVLLKEQLKAEDSKMEMELMMADKLHEMEDLMADNLHEMEELMAEKLQAVEEMERSKRWRWS